MGAVPIVGYGMLFNLFSMVIVLKNLQTSICSTQLAWLALYINPIFDLSLQRTLLCTVLY